MKGSVDPLGQLTIWSRFGRAIVGNLTTVANSARDFGVLLMGAWLAQEISERTRVEQDLQTFLKWESLVAYSRVDRQVQARPRGVERVRRRLNDTRSPLISAEKPEQILSNQKMYGLYGLFTVPSRRSGLLEEGRLRLTPDARKFVEDAYVSKLDTPALISMLTQPSFKFHLTGRHSDLADNVSQVFGPKLSKSERTFFREWLLFAQHADAPVQAAAAEVMLSTVDDADFSFNLTSVTKLAVEAGRRFKESPLEQRLLDIVTCESVIGPAAQLFSFTLGREGDSLDEIASDVTKIWKSGLTRTVHPEAFARLELSALVGSQQSAWWKDLAVSLHAGDWKQTIELMLRINASVMQGRGNSAAWAELERGKLKVRRRDESAALTPWKQVPEIFLHPYFLSSLWQVAKDVGASS